MRALLRRAVLLPVFLIGCRETGPETGKPATPVVAPSSAVGFGTILGAQELADGRWLVSDFTERRVRVYSPEGDSVVSIDRVGPGPNEYLRPAPLWRLGNDSILMVNQFQRRWDLFHGANLVGSTIPVEPTNTALVSFDTLGSMLMVRNGPTAQDSQLVVLINRATGSAQTVTHLEPPFPGYTDLPPPYPGQWADAAIAPDGWVAIRRVNPYRVDWVRPGGDLVRGDSLAVRRIEVDAKEKAFYVGTMSEARAQLVAADADWPTFVPAVAGTTLLFAPSGELLVERIPSSVAPERTYDVIGRDARRARTFVLPRKSRIIAFGRTAAFVVTEDADGFLRPAVIEW